MFDVCGQLKDVFVPPADVLTCFQAPGAPFAVLSEFNSRCSSIAGQINTMITDHDGGPSAGFRCSFDGLLITPGSCTESVDSVSRLNGAIDAYLTGHFDCTRTTSTTTTTPTTQAPDFCPADCCEYFDGCNTCFCESGLTLGCSTRTCDTLAAPACLSSCPSPPPPPPPPQTTAAVLTTPGPAPASTTAPAVEPKATTLAATTTLLTEVTSGSKGIDLLPRRSQELEDGSGIEGGDFCFNSDSGGLKILAAPAAGSSFTLRIDASVRSQTAGYLYARARSSGFRFVGLYVRSRNRGMIFFYKAVGSSAQSSVTFAFSELGDEATHSIELSVRGIVATLSVDSVVVGSETLSGYIDDCGVPGPECITHVGQRQRGYPLTGCVSAASIEPAAPEAFDLLNPEIHNGATAFSDNVYCFDGSGSSSGLQLAAFPASSTTFNLLVTFRVAEGASGYLVAKGAGGKSRYFSLYIRRSDQRVVMYYRSIGSTRQRSAIITKSAVVGENTLRVSVQKNVARAMLITSESTKEDVTVVLAGPVDDCTRAGDDCTFHVGQRAGGLELDQGCIFSAELFPGRA